MAKRNITLSGVGNLAVIIICAIWGIRLGLQFWGPDIEQMQTVDGYSPGSRIDRLQLQLGEAKRTLLMVTSSKCNWCTITMPSYRRVVTAARELGIDVMGLTAEDAAQNRKYLASHGIEIDKIVPLSETALKVEGTPALILVRDEGVVINSWRGMLNERGEKSVLAAIAGT